MLIKGGGGGARGFGTPSPTLKITKIGFFSNTGPDTMKKSQRYRASRQCWVIVGTPAKRNWNCADAFCTGWYFFSHVGTIPALENSIEMAFRWRADDGLLIVVFGSFLCSSKIKETSKFDPV